MDSTAHGTCIDNRTIHDITTSHRSRYMPVPRWRTKAQRFYISTKAQKHSELYITTLQVQQQAVEVLERRNRAKQTLIRRALAESLDPKYATVSVDEPVRCRCST